MTLQYALTFQLLMLVAVLGMGDGRKELLSAQSTTKGEVIAVSFCDLMKDKGKFEGKSVQVTATVLVWLDGTALYDSRCRHDGLEPVLDCKDEEECAAMRKLLEEKTDFNGDVGRVEVVLTGKFVGPPNTSPGNSRYRLMIKTIEQVTQIPPEVPWPGERP